jgi:hypothetical protein
MLTERARRLLQNPDSADSLGGRARARRWEVFKPRFPDFAEMRVADLGGDTRYWRTAPVQPKELVVVNPESWAFGDPEPWMSFEQADACELSERFFGERFDMVYSNSTIEHVGGPLRRQAFATAVHRLAPRHWVQTPYRYFPLEPHWVFPGFQFLPLRARAQISERWPLSARRGRSTIDYVLHVDLLSLTEMKFLFPESEMYKERAAGLVKSLVAVRT